MIFKNFNFMIEILKFLNFLNKIKSLFTNFAFSNNYCTVYFRIKLNILKLNNLLIKYRKRILKIRKSILWKDKKISYLLFCNLPREREFNVLTSKKRILCVGLEWRSYVAAQVESEFYISTQGRGSYVSTQEEGSYVATPKMS